MAQPTTGNERPAPREAVDEEREELAVRVSNWLEFPLAVLALISLALLVAELTGAGVGSWDGWIVEAQLPISLIFFVAFVFELAIAPSKLRYLRSNWLTAIAVFLPFLRIFRAARALRLLRGARALRGLSVVRVVTGLNRSTRALGRFLEENFFGYVLLLTALITITSAAGVFYLERTNSEANITTFGDALWFAATVVTTINSPHEPVTLEGRILAFLLRIFGLAVIGYLTATIAVFLIGRYPRGGESELRDELRSVREQLASLEETIRANGPRDRT